MDNRIVKNKERFEELFEGVQGLTDVERVAFLDKLQEQLEEEKLIEPRTDEAQRKQARDKMFDEWIKESDNEGEELDANLTDRELLEMIKNI